MGLLVSYSGPLLLEYGVLFYLNLPTTGHSPPPRQPVLLWNLNVGLYGSYDGHPGIITE